MNNQIFSYSCEFLNHLNTSVDEDVKEFKENKVFRDLSRDSREADAFRGNRQTILCSATIPQRKYFAEACFRNGWTETLPELVNVSQDKLLPENIEHEVIVCDKEQRLQVTAYVLRQEYQRLLSLRSLLEQQRQKEEQTFGFQCIIFVDQESKIDVYADFLLTSLEKHGMLPSSNSLNEKTPSVWVRTLTAEMNIEDRRQSLHSFRRQESAILLCTDLASRGIDIPATALVMQVRFLRSSCAAFLGQDVEFFSFLLLALSLCSLFDPRPIFAIFIYNDRIC